MKQRLKFSHFEDSMIAKTIITRNNGAEKT